MGQASGKTIDKTRNFFRDHGLSLILFSIFLFVWAGQFFTGMKSFNEELRQHHFPQVSASEYVSSGHFIESTFENWESEFLQMAFFVILTAFTYQRGSSESNPLPDEKVRPEPQFRKRYFLHHPWLRKIYENSLSLALLLLFLISFGAHMYGGWKQENLQRLMTRDPQGPVSLAEFAFGSEFWYQSFQNWQSEFLSVGVMVVLTIFLRQKDSAQSKPVDSPHWKTED